MIAPSDRTQLTQAKPARQLSPCDPIGCPVRLGPGEGRLRPWHRLCKSGDGGRESGAIRKECLDAYERNRQMKLTFRFSGITKMLGGLAAGSLAVVTLRTAGIWQRYL